MYIFLYLVCYKMAKERREIAMKQKINKITNCRKTWEDDPETPFTFDVEKEKLLIRLSTQVHSSRDLLHYCAISGSLQAHTIRHLDC